VKKDIVIGSRGSRLAEIQARLVIKRLSSIYPGVKFSLTKIKTKGDQQKSKPLAQIKGYGVFVKEVQEALLGGSVDLAVHSLKDLPFQTPPGLLVAAITERLDPRDVLVSKGEKLPELAPGSVIGTGSPRRTAQLLAFRPDLKVESIRGNIDTRVCKVLDGEVDGIIVAATAILRLGWQDKITQYLPLEQFLPEAGQGALAIEVRTEDKDMLKLVKVLHDEPTGQCVAAERTFVQMMGGGCSTAIAALGEISGDKLRLRGMASSNEGIIYAVEEGSPPAPEEVARRLAEKLKGMGAL